MKNRRYKYSEYPYTMKSLEYLYSRNWLERGYISSNYTVELSSKISRISQYKNIQETQISKYRKSRKYKYPKYPPTRKSWEYKYSRNWLYRGFLEIKISKYQEIQETQISRISADKEICGIQTFEKFTISGFSGNTNIQNIEYGSV